MYPKQNRGGGEPVEPTKQGMSISASLKCGTRRRRLSKFWGNEWENRIKEEGGEGGVGIFLQKGEDEGGGGQQWL